MKRFKKLFLLVIAAIFILSLASCKNKEVRNTSVPLGELASTQSQVIATAKHDVSITQEKYYTRLRANGYNTFLNNVKKALFNKELDEVKNQIDLNDGKVNDYEQELFDAYSSDLYLTASADALKDVAEKEIDTRIRKYKDICSNKGITITDANTEYVIVDNKIQFKSIPTEIIDEKLINIAVNKATKDALKEIVDLEKVENDEGKMVTNTNHIVENDIKAYYESNQKNYGTYQAIIIQFNTLAEANKAMDYVEAKIGPLSDTNAIHFYAELYNYYYAYRTRLAENPFEDPNSSDVTTYVVNKDQDDLSEVSSSVKNILTTVLEKDGTYLHTPFNQNNKYLMVYRGESQSEVNEKYNITPVNEALDWDDLKSHKEAYDAVYAETKDQLIDNKISSYSSTVLKKRIKEAEIKVYDPYLEYQFKTDYADQYSYINPSDFNNSYIFEINYNNNKTAYAVKDFYNEVSKNSGLALLVEALQLDYIYQYKDRFLESDEVTKFSEELDEELEKFNKDKNEAYPSIIGQETYLLKTYGYNTREDVIKYAKEAQAILSDYLTENVFDEWAKVNENGTYPDDHSVDYDKLNILQNILDYGNENYKKLFSINIDHILIFIDDDGDGNPDDPKDFLKNIEDQDDFNTCVLQLSQAIYNESKCEKLTKANDLMEILEYIVKAYNKDEALYSNPEDNWANYKKYNFQLKVESLSSSGDTTQSNVTNYVEDFANYIRELYATVTKDKLETENGDKPTLYFNYTNQEGTKGAPTSINEICATEFGYHLIVVNDYDTPTSTQKTASSDTNNYQKNIEILLNEKDEDNIDDNIYVIIPNTYNEDKDKVNMNQFFTYYVQTQKGITSSLDSSIRDLLNSMFDKAISRYTSADFQKYLLFNQLEIKISDSTLANAAANYSTYLKNVSQSYDVKDDFDAWYGDYNWSRPY